MVESSTLSLLQDFGVSGVLVVVIYYMIKYINKKDDVIQNMINVNQEQNEQIRETNVLLKELTSYQKECKEYAKYGYWWVLNHQPSEELCSNCDDYDTCLHPKKVIFRRNRK